VSQKRYRRIKINGPDGIGYKTSIIDLETGEMIPNIEKIVLTLIPEELIKAELTLVEMSDRGTVLRADDNKPLRSIQRVHQVEMDILAYEEIKGEDV